jgi:uncharacterized protein (UPF0210 family)
MEVRAGDDALIETIPEALTQTQKICASVNVGTTRGGINMDAVVTLGRQSKTWPNAAAIRGVWGSQIWWCLPTSPGDNPFMAGANSRPQPARSGESMLASADLA